jgi:pyruvate/2-oxoglutarate dehydrogenase complex dihydrolipoamide dehydrogenase (E3) component
MVVHEAMREGFLAATNAVLDGAMLITPAPSPIGSFTDPEYASVGLSEAAARQAHDVLVVTEPFDRLPRPLIDGRPVGFCKLIVDRQQRRVLGCHIVGERAVELAQLGAVTIASQMTIDQLALVPFSFPTYANALGRAAIKAARELLGVRAGIEPFDVGLR